MTTVWNLSKTGFMAMEASIQLKWRMGLEMFGVRSSKGSMMSTNPTINTAEVKDRVGDIWCAVVKGFNDEDEAYSKYKMRHYKGYYNKLTNARLHNTSIFQDCIKSNSLLSIMFQPEIITRKGDVHFHLNYG